MKEPRLSRPYMPGYGMLPAGEGTGLLPWPWAEEKLIASRNYWLVSVWPDGRPHAMPVWGMWHEGTFWFSSSRESRKTRNLTADSRCVVATEDTQNPVIVEGKAELVTSPKDLATMLALENAKYLTDYGIETLDPAVNTSFRVTPSWVFGLEASDFTGSPTRWDFAPTRKGRTRTKPSRPRSRPPLSSS